MAASVGWAAGSIFRCDRRLAPVMISDFRSETLECENPGLMSCSMVEWSCHGWFKSFVSRSLFRPFLGFGKINELDVENEQSGWLSTGTIVAVCQSCRNPESGLLTNSHELNPLGPPFDDPIQRGGKRHASLHRRVKLHPVGCLPGGVMSGDDRGGPRMSISLSLL